MDMRLSSLSIAWGKMSLNVYENNLAVIFNEDFQIYEKPVPYRY